MSSFERHSEGPAFHSRNGSLIGYDNGLELRRDGPKVPDVVTLLGADVDEIERTIERGDDFQLLALYHGHEDRSSMATLQTFASAIQFRC